MSFSFIKDFIDEAVKVSKTVYENVNKTLDDSIFKELNRENQEFIENKKKTQEMPWRNNETLKKSIIDLSTDKAVFISNPPRNVEFPFRLSSYRTLISRLKKMDPVLEEREREFVPYSLSEYDFWRNYFYNVSKILEENPQKSAPIELVSVKKEDSDNVKEDELTIEDIDMNECEIDYDGENWKDAVEDLLRSESI